MIALREGLRWATEGAWIQDLPADYQWLGMSAAVYPWLVLIVVVALQVGIRWGLRKLPAGRPSTRPARARRPRGSPAFASRSVTSAVFTMAGALVGLAALLNSVRFNQIPSNTGLGLELKVIAAVVVGGTAITGGRGSVRGTLLGVVLLSAIGPALTFLGVSAYWERALHGVIILAAVAVDALARPALALRQGRRAGAALVKRFLRTERVHPAARRWPSRSRCSPRSRRTSRRSPTSSRSAGSASSWACWRLR